ncbi:MAG: MFS transporter, partial [Planctomycetota bacterium]
MTKTRYIETGMILSMTGLYFFSFFQRVAIPGSIFNDVQTEFAVSAADVTLLSAIYLFIYASLQPFAGYLADRYGGIRVVIISGILLFLGSVLFPSSRNLWELYISRGLVGLGASTMYLCLVKETDHYFKENFAPVFGLVCLLGYSGGLVATRPFRSLVEHIGWRDSCYYAAFATLIILIVTGIMKRKLGREEVSNRE